MTNSYPGPVRPQLFLKEAEFQDAVPSTCVTGHLKGPVVQHARSEERMLPFSYSPTPQEVSSTYLQGSGLRVPGTPLRAFTGTTYLHKVYGRSTGASVFQGNSSLELPGRLVGLCPIKRASYQRHQNSVETHPVSGSNSERKENQLTLSQEVIFIGISIDSSLMRASLPRERVDTILSFLNRFRLGQTVSVLECQRLLSPLMVASLLFQLGLLHLRPLQQWFNSHWLHPKLHKHHRDQTTLQSWHMSFTRGV